MIYDITLLIIRNDKNARRNKMYNKCKELKKRTKGITLLALVVTIIVLLILAWVAINFSIGDGGILKRAEDAASKYEEASIKEVIDIS